MRLGVSRENVPRRDPRCQTVPPRPARAYNPLYVKLLRRFTRFAILLSAAGLLASVPARRPGPARAAAVVGGGPRDARRGRVGDVQLLGAGTPGTCAEDTGFFNYSDYEHSTLRMLRIDLKATVQPRRRTSRSRRGPQREYRGRRSPSALHAASGPGRTRRSISRRGASRRPLAPLPADLRQPTTSLIGYPLAYQYLTSLRPDALPANADELLSDARARLAVELFGRQHHARRGVPLAGPSAGIPASQVHADDDLVDATASVTTGTLGNPLVADDNAGRQVVRPGGVPSAAGADHRRLGRSRAVRDARRGARAPA